MVESRRWFGTEINATDVPESRNIANHHQSTSVINVQIAVLNN
jgi:hypothetical protein